MGHNDYHSFRLPYWDWRAEIQKSSRGIRAEELFIESRLGATKNISGFPRVVGDIVGPNGWDTLCIGKSLVICDPEESTGALQRCPLTGNNPCHSDNPDWPTIKTVNDAISFDTYDSPPYTLFSTTGYRSFVDFSIHKNLTECGQDRKCTCLPFGGPSCDLSNVPEAQRSLVSAYVSQLHGDVS